MTSLLVTNDYPPKIGGIQSYLWELWRRLPASEVVVLTRRQPGADAFDSASPHRIARIEAPMLLPTRRVIDWIKSEVERTGAGLVLLDPALPLGLVGPKLGVPYGVVVHGAELTVPARVPGSARLIRRVIAGARLVVAAGGYPALEARRLVGEDLPGLLVVPPGVDGGRFHPLSPDEIANTRQRFGLPPDGRLVVSHSRLVPRKGMDVLIEASAKLVDAHSDLTVAIAGSGRDASRLEALIKRLGSPVRMLGRVDDTELPALVASADVSAMFCRTRWAGLEQEGFGIVFLEAAACGVAAIAGRSGGAAEAVVNGETGIVVDRPGDVVVAAAALARLLDDEALRKSMGAAARERAVREFDYGDLADRLAVAIRGAGG